MKLLMNIWTAIYLAGVIIGWRLHVISEDTYFICMGMWAITFIIINIWEDHHERW